MIYDVIDDTRRTKTTKSCAIDKVTRWRIYTNRSINQCDRFPSSPCKGISFVVYLPTTKSIKALIWKRALGMHFACGNRVHCIWINQYRTSRRESSPRFWNANLFFVRINKPDNPIIFRKLMKSNPYYFHFYISFVFPIDRKPKFDYTQRCLERGGGGGRAATESEIKYNFPYLPLSIYTSVYWMWYGENGKVDFE